MSFRLKIVLGLMLIQVTLILILVWSSLNFLRISNEVELSNRAASIVSILASTLGPVVAAGDVDGLDAEVRELLTQPDLVYIRIRGQGGTLAEGGDPAALGRPFAEDFLFEDAADGVYDVSAMIRDQGAAIGQIEIGLSTAAVSDIMAAARREMATIAIIGLGLSVIFSLMLGNYFARQLTRLKDATRRIASGDIGYQLAVAGIDELAQTANAFNTMSRKLAMLYSEKQSALNRARQKADELHESERRIHAVLNHAMDAIVTFDDGGTIESFNPAGERIFGYGAAEAIGQDLSILMPEPYLTEHRDAMKESPRGGDGADGFGATREIEGLRKDGGVFPMEIDVSEVSIEGRRLFIAIARDITRRREAEHELRMAQEAALESSRSKFEFIANVSQEIRAPVNEILGSLNLLAASGLPPGQQARIDGVRESGNALITVINDMLDFSRIEAGKLELEDIDFDLWQTVDTVFRMFRNTAADKGIELAYVIPCPTPSALRGDPTRLRQILINLFDNALKFTDRGEVVLRIAVTDQSDGHVTLRFEIEDTGIGIAPAVQQRIFEIFTHAGVVQGAPSGMSSGLGLMISRHLAEMMHGTIGVSSEIGRGSVFWFTARFGRAAAQAESAPRPRDLSHLKALLVNPDAAACEAMRAMVGESGVRARCVGDGMEALTELGAAANRGRPYDLVIFDRVLGGMNGLQFAHAVRGDRRIARTAMIMVAATGYRGDGEEVRQAGIQGYLTAPVAPAQLQACIAGVAGGDTFVTRHTLEASSAPLQGQEYALAVSSDPARRKALLARLERQGYRAGLAVDAGQALAALGDHAWRLVVVDNTESELVGADVLRTIARGGRADGAHVPVVVLVAPGVGADERQAWRSAGADECISGLDDIDALKRRAGAGA